MSPLQPNALSDEELARYGRELVESEGLPKKWQRELLYRFTLLLDEQHLADQAQKR